MDNHTKSERAIHRANLPRTATVLGLLLVLVVGFSQGTTAGTTETSIAPVERIGDFQAPISHLPQLPNLAGVQTVAVTATSNAGDLAAAMATTGTTILQSGWLVYPPNGNPAGVANSVINTFPSDGSTFALLSSGDVTYTEQPNTSGSTSANNGGTDPDRGANSDYDAVILYVDVLDPRGPLDGRLEACLSVEFRFYSEEFPEWVGTQYNDAFVGEVDVSNWETAGSPTYAVVAPLNFIITPDVVAINNPGIVSGGALTPGMTAAAASGTTYDGATAHYRAYTSLPAPTGNTNTHRIFFSVFDQGDHIYDSTVFLDNLRAYVAVPGDPCLSGIAERVAD